MGCGPQGTDGAHGADHCSASTNVCARSTPPTRWRWRCATSPRCRRRRPTRSTRRARGRTMIGSLRGTLLDRMLDGELLVEVGGRRLPGARSTPRRWRRARLTRRRSFVHVHHHVREDAQTLYGFATSDERVCFEALLSAHGVGPSLALAIMSVHSPDAAASRARRRRCRRAVHGAGRRQEDGGPPARRAQVPAGPPGRCRRPGQLAEPGGDGRRPSALADVRDALLGLGYSHDEIRRRAARPARRRRSGVLVRQALQAPGTPSATGD